MAPRIQAGILSDSRLFRDTISYRLAFEEEIELIGATSTVHDLLVQARARPVEILLVRLNVESAMGAEVVWDIKTLLPAARVIVLGFEESEAEMLKWIEAGAIAYLEHDASYQSLLETIQAVSQGRTPCSLGFLTRVIRRIDELAAANHQAESQEPETLSGREVEVARLLALGLVNKHIARRLGIKTPTVKTHIHHILKKLQVKRRRDVIRRLQGGTFEEG